jgi:hypothetical protein
VAYTFNGVTKRITLSSGTVVLDLIDLHSRWKDWLLLGNAGFVQAFGTVGGETPKIPLYLFVSNGWKIVPQSANHALSVINGVLETDDASEPFVDPAGGYSIRIKLESPGIAIGYSSSGSTGPTAESIAAAIGQRVIDNGLSNDALLRILLAALAGKTAGLGTDTEQYLAQDGITPRITAQFDANNNRTSVTLNGV